VDSENARAAREGSPPIRVVDYRVFLPAPKLPDTGLESLGRSFAASLGALNELRSLF